MCCFSFFICKRHHKTLCIKLVAQGFIFALCFILQDGVNAGSYFIYFSWFPICIDPHMCRGSFGKQFAKRFVYFLTLLFLKGYFLDFSYFITKFQADRRDCRNFCENSDTIVIIGRCFVLYIYSQNRQEKPLFLELSISHAVFSHPFSSSNLKPDDIVAVMHNSHL